MLITDSFNESNGHTFVVIVKRELYHGFNEIIGLNKLSKHFFKKEKNPSFSSRFIFDSLLLTISNK